MKIATLILVSFLLPTCLQAQDYSSLFIPDSLRKGADLVKREEEYILTIKSAAKFSISEKHVYSILNSAAANYASYQSYYDKFSSINNLSGRLFDKWGKQLKHTKKGDWKDYSAYDGFSLLSDARYKSNEFFSAEYPFTVEYEEETDYNGTQGFPRWIPQSRSGMSVQSSRFIIIAPASYKVRFKQLNFSGDPVISQKGDVKTYVWEIKNMMAKKYEPFAPPFTELTPVVFFAPSTFEVHGFEGDMSTWEGYGKFMYQLIKDRDVLPAEIKKKVHELTDALKDDRAKSLVLYDYLQKNTRYISIQLGIGGWQPFEASYVAEKKYGDCKALSNYMIALLKEAGIKGKYIEIYGGSTPPPFVSDFSFSQANHVIACVPLAKDTLWLECTSQTASGGYLGSFTGNRKALLIDEKGGQLVNTPVYTIQDNVQQRMVQATLDGDGNLMADIDSRYTGLQQEFAHSLMHNASNKEREEYLNSMFNLPTYQVVKNNYTEEKGMIPSVKESLKVSITNYATVTGKRLFIAANIFGSATTKMQTDTARKYDYLVKNAYRELDSVMIKIPAGYIAESLPKDIMLNSKFGKYVCSVKVENDKITYYRVLEKFSGRFPPTEYRDLVKFHDQVYKADRNKIVLVKGE